MKAAMLRADNTTNDTTTIDRKLIQSGPNNNITESVYYEFGQTDKSTVYMLLQNNKTEAWEPPSDAVNKPTADGSQRLSMSKFKLNKKPFSFSIGSTYSDKELFTTEGQTTWMMDRFIQIDFKINSQKLYGLGERNRGFALDQGTWTMWANGQETPYDDGTGFQQTYGVHPFVLIKTNETNQFMGMYFRSSNAQSPIIKFNDDGSTTFRYITVGGKVEAYFLMQGSAKEII
jgi:hypothetical protein